MVLVFTIAGWGVHLTCIYIYILYIYSPKSASKTPFHRLSEHGDLAGSFVLALLRKQ